MSKTYYMHTLDGKPAGFFFGKSVCYSSSVILCGSLKQIRREQKISRDNDFLAQFNYGYQRVRLP